jgi:predicted RNA-binding Zn-ribbon protein involved in translation (DUF1610 family)
MLDGICPKCGSNDVYSDVNLDKSWYRDILKAVMMKGGLVANLAYLENFVCVQCGHVESYISDPNKLPDIAQNWTKVLVRE